MRKFITVKSLVVLLTIVLVSAVTLILTAGNSKAVTNSVFSGALTDEYGTPISQASVTLANGPNGSASSTSDANGNFSISATPGTYNLWISGDNLAGMDQVGGNYTTQTIDLSNGDVTQNLQLDVATVHITLVDQSGNPVPNAQITAHGSGSVTYFPGYSSQSTVSSGVVTDASGSGDLKTLVGESYVAGTGNGDYLCAQTTPRACLTSSTTINGDTSVTLQVPPSHSFSGYLTDQNDNPIPNASVDLLNGPNGTQWSTTNSSGYFNVIVTPGTYNLGVVGDNLDGMQLGGNYTAQPIDLTSSDINQNIQLQTVPLHVTVEDVYGNPLSNVYVLATGSGTITYFPGYQGQMQVNPSSNTNTLTDINGNLNLTTLIGVTYQPGTSTNSRLCAQTSPIICLTSAVSINGETFVTLQPTLSAPGSLTASSPARTPNLSWSAVNGATSYNIFRDGTNIDSTSVTSYSDNSATEGSHTYYVTAVNSSQESSGSNTKTVLVDKTNPVITYTVSPLTTSYGWNSTNVTISFTCSDSSTGVTSCSNPVNVSNETLSQIVTGTAVDGAGNTATVSVTVRVDKTAPSAGTPSVSPTPLVMTIGGSVTAPASDTLSGIAGGEFFIDTDPGTGNGTPMAVSGSSITGSIAPNTLASGQHTVYVRSQDLAGNWSTASVGTNFRVSKK